MDRLESWKRGKSRVVVLAAAVCWPQVSKSYMATRSDRLVVLVFVMICVLAEGWKSAMLSNSNRRRSVYVRILSSPSASPDEMVEKARQLRADAAALEEERDNMLMTRVSEEDRKLFSQTERGDGMVSVNELKALILSLLTERGSERDLNDEDMSALAKVLIARFGGPEADGLLTLRDFPSAAELMGAFNDEHLKLEKQRLEQVLEQNAELYESLAEQSKGRNGWLGTGLTFNEISAFAWNAGPVLFGAYFVSRIIAQGILEGEESVSQMLESLTKLTSSSPF